MKTIPLTKGKVATVDDEDFDRLSQFSWHATSHGYAATRLRDEAQTHVYMHRMILNAPPWVQVDHVNGDRLDNRRANIRKCASKDNSANAGKRTATTLSPYKGVTFDRSKGLWLAQIVKDGVRQTKRFYSEQEAARWYNEKAVELFGEFARLNEIDESRPDPDLRPVSRYDDVAKRLKDQWGFRMWKNDKNTPGYREGECRSGYTVAVDLRGLRYVRYDSLARIERAWLSGEQPPKTIGRRFITKPVLQYTLKGEFVREWESAAEVVRTLGLNSGGLSMACQGKARQVGGFKWRFK